MSISDGSDSDGYESVNNPRSPSALRISMRHPIPNRPAIPPKPQIISTQSSVDKGDTKTPPPHTLSINIENYNILPEELPLNTFVENHQEQFPLRVHVCRGYYGASERFSVSEGDIFNVHFIKKAKVGVVQDSSRVNYRIPLNSTVEFGFVYNPESNFQKALDGYKFPKISDVLAVTPLPKALRATVAFKGTSSDNSIDKNELVIVKELKMNGSRRNLIVYSVTAQKIKKLFESCEGHFSTKPYDIRLFLPEIFEHVSQPFPSLCYLFMNAEGNHDLPHHLFSSATTLTSESIDLSLIASTNYEVGGQPLLVEIPVDLDIEVQIMQPKDECDFDSLYEKTDDLMKNFDPSKVHTLHGRLPNAKATKQAVNGVELVMPNALRRWTSSREVSDPAPSLPPVPVEALPSVPVTSSHFFPPPSEQTTTPPHANKLSRDLMSTRADLKRLDIRFTKELEALKEQMKKIASTLEGMATLPPSQATDAQQRQLSPLVVEKPRLNSVSSDADPKEQNIQFLRSMDTSDVLKLLEVMSLIQYSQVIAKEHISGDILVECTEEVLEKELHIESKLHRVRIMKIIDGSHSARGILKGEGPYGSLQSH